MFVQKVNAEICNLCVIEASTTEKGGPQRPPTRAHTCTCYIRHLNHLEGTSHVLSIITCTRQNRRFRNDLKTKSTDTIMPCQCFGKQHKASQAFKCCWQFQYTAFDIVSVQKSAATRLLSQWLWKGRKIKVIKMYFGRRRGADAGFTG